jgi:hypothetical protein
MTVNSIKKTEAVPAEDFSYFTGLKMAKRSKQHTKQNKTQIDSK